MDDRLCINLKLITSGILDDFTPFTSVRIIIIIIIINDNVYGAVHAVHGAVHPYSIVVNKKRGK